jgi:acetate---CoA ligase (ADP-forming) subunit alpha
MSINLDPLFYPKSVAVIGASPNVIRDRAGFFYSLKECFKGKLYGVNPKYTDIEGIECFPKINDVPERVDYAFIMLPREKVNGVLKECVIAKVKFVLVFTSGFSEMGEYALEEELIETIKGSETRIVGPNCIGAHCPESGLVFYAQLNSDIRGDVAFFSQSGGHALNFTIRGLSIGLDFNKVISLGNQANLAIEDFIEYFAEDDRIKFICGYAEDVKDGERFKNGVKKTILENKKPLVLWKGGRSVDGARATSSHTGAVAVPTKIWDSVMDQLGVINVENQNELADVMIVLKLGFLPQGRNVAIAVAGGGSSVELTDGVSLNGLSVPTLSEEIQKKIGVDISAVNTSTKNPIDLGMFGFAPNIFVNSMMLAAEDPNIDIVMGCQYPEMIKAMAPDAWDMSVNILVEGLSKVKKPTVMIIPRVYENSSDAEAVRAEFIGRLREVGIPAYPSAARMARAAVKIQKYVDFMKIHGVDIFK